MSKYTTEVRYICEKEAGYNESKGYNDIDEIISKSIPKIFSFDFPIFDEAYRNVLCSKILRHYYTREICVETYGLWKLRLQTKLTEIMPFYNQLYESELIKFNPLYDVDLQTRHEGEKFGTENGKTSETNVYNDKTDNLESGSRTYNDREIEIGNVNNQNSSVEKQNNTGEKVGVSNLSENNDSQKVGATNSSESNDSQKFNNAKSIEKENYDETKVGSTNETKNIDRSEDNERDTNKESIATNEQNTNTGKKNTFTNAKNDNTSDLKYDLYSDTPQGALTGVDAENYLTNARKNTDKLDKTSTEVGNSDESVNSSTKNNGTGIENENVKESKTESNDETRSANVNDNVLGNKNNNKENNESSFENSNNEKKTNETESNVNNIERKNNEAEFNNSQSENNSSSNGSENSERIGSKETSETNSGNRTTTNVGNRLGNSNRENVISSTEAYTLHVIGKQAGASYSKLLREFRDTFLNIDLDIIKDLAPLFMNIW